MPPEWRKLWIEESEEDDETGLHKTPPVAEKV